jgi:osmotically-inducible protein OsmY
MRIALPCDEGSRFRTVKVGPVDVARNRVAQVHLSAHKVESELFRDPSVPKGQISINAQRGVVQLRGEVPSIGMVTELIERTRRVQGVRDVESLLHLHGVDAPMHQ